VDVGWKSANKAIKSVANRPLKALGYEIRRIPPQEAWVYDPWQVQARLLRRVDEPVIFDVGANVGQTFQNYLRVLPNALIHSFEPFPDSYRTLAEKAAGHPTVKTHQVAVADKVGNRVFHTNPEFHTRNSLLARPAGEGRRYHRSFAELTKDITVRVETLDDYCASEGIDHIDILKLDVQGAETLALRGAENLLTQQRIDAVYTEILFAAHYEDQATFDEQRSVMDSTGYSLFNLYELRIATNGQLRYANALFVSDNLRKEVIDKFPPEP
jgi:FkbM family methyltransferase